VIREAALDHNPPPLSSPRPRPFLVSSTRSPLANPNTPIHKLAAEIQSCLYFPDPGPLYAVCGALIANTMRGYPVWIMLVGPPESGKTELLKPLLNLDSCRECGDLSGKAALLSGTKAKERTADATGGLLASIPKSPTGFPRGMLVMLDFARTILAADPAASRASMGAIGMLHDQHYQREVGTDGGKTLSFSGKIGFVTACTDVIDSPDNQRANAEMGERCLYYRYPKSEGYHEIDSALDNPDGPGKSNDLALHFLNWSFEMNLDWDELPLPRPLSDQERKTISILSQFCARGRSAVQRDRWNHNEISGITRSALGPRIANTFAQLLRGMERIGCTPNESLDVLRHCAMDSLPSTRAAAIQAIQNGLKGASDIAGRIGIAIGAAKRTLEDLKVHGLLDCAAPDSSGPWRISEKAEAMLRMGWDE